MSILLQILLALLISLLGGLYILGAFRRERSGEPPLDKGPLPWLGHVLEFRRDSAKFLERMRKKHGDIFTVLLGGFYFTFIMDPHSFGSVVKEARSKLDYAEFLRLLIWRVFGFHPIEGDHKLIRASSNKHLMGENLVVLTQSMMNNLQDLMLHSMGSGNDNDDRLWQEDGLFIYCYNIVFHAGYLSLFGKEVANTSESVDKSKEVNRKKSNELFYEFRKYQRLFPNLSYGVLGPSEKMEAERLKRLFWKVLAVEKIKTKENTSDWVSETYQVRAEYGVPESILARYMFLLLSVTQGNTGPESFWLLLFLMKHPEAMEAVKNEVDEVLRETGQEVKRGGPMINLTRDMLLKTPVLDSALDESLRMTAAPMLIQAVMEDMTLKMDNGLEYNVCKGDRVALFPYTTVQTDPEVHPDPHTFKYNRFLTPEGGIKTKFYKGGKKLKYYNMPWGAGLSMCPGRFFAVNELKQFIFLMLTYFDVELKNPDEEIPDIDVRRWGFGTRHKTFRSDIDSGFKMFI